jgi:hypothetical protein
MRCTSSTSAATGSTWAGAKLPQVPHLLDRAREIAEEVFFPASLAVDAAPRVPAAHLDLLAAEGFYGMAAPHGPDLPTACRVVEALASGCLTTTFVFQQHHGAVRGVAASATPGIAGTWLEPLCRGLSRAGTVQAALRPGPPSVRVRRVERGYLFAGTAPWVSGWGMVDVLHTAARDEHDTVHWGLLDAVPGPTLSVEPMRLVAANASGTVVLHLADHFVPEDRLVTVAPHAGGQSTGPAALRMNGSLALGVAGRCASLLGSAALRDEVDECRAALDAALGDDQVARAGVEASVEAGAESGVDAEPEAGVEAMADARAAASALAMRAASLLTVATGARSLLGTEHAQRLVREATFLLVFGSRPAIKAALLRRYPPAQV